MHQNIVIGIDIGSLNLHIVAASVYRDTGRIEILASLTMPSQGIRKGTVINPQELAESLRTAIKTLEKKVGISIDDVYTTISGPYLEAKESKGVVAISRADGEVSEEDIQRVIGAAETFSLPQNREIIHTIPQEFAVDRETGIENPKGMTGVRLELNALVVKAFKPYVKNLIEALSLANLRNIDFVFSPLASATACLSRRQKELGVIIIDFGAAITNIAVYEENVLRHAAVLSVGSSHITNDIAIAFKIPIDLAETLKIKFGAALEKNISKNEKIDFKKFGIPEEKIARTELIKVIEARVREVMQLVNKELIKINREKMLPAGAVIVGGGANLAHIAECAKEELGLPAQIGYPIEIEGLIEEINHPDFAAAVGLVKWAKEFHQKSSKNQLRHSGTFRLYFKRIKDFLKNLIP